MTAVAEKRTRPDGVAAMRQACAPFIAQVFRAFYECSDEIQKGILEMAEVLDDPKSTDEEKQMAVDDIMESLFPTAPLGVDLGEEERSEAGERKQSLAALDHEEDTFAERLRTIMKEKGINQSELAEAARVGQPAISMMLTRNCHPQRRTVQKLAKALQVKPGDLWPHIATK